MKNILINKIKIIIQIFSIVASMNLLASHTIRVGLTYESESGLRASGCALYQDASGNVDSNTMSCYLFDDDKCRIKTFSLEGVPKAPYINWTIPKNASNKDIQCGFNNVANSNDIYQRLLSNNVLSGNSPKSSAKFELSTALLNGFAGKKIQTHVIYVNKNSGVYPACRDGQVCEPDFRGDAVTDLTSIGCNLEEDYVTCYFINDTSCKKRQYAINGAPVGLAETKSDCGFNNTSISQPLYDNFDILKFGVSPSVMPVFNAYLSYISHTVQPLFINVKYSDEYNTDIFSNTKVANMNKFGTDTWWGRAIGCAPHPNDPGTKYRCYALNNYNCSYTDIAKNGTVINYTTSLPNCGYYQYINETQLLFDSMTIVRIGQPPIAKQTENLFHTDSEIARIKLTDYSSYYDIMFYSFYLGKILVYKVASNVGRAYFNYNKLINAVGCQQLAGEPHYAECIIMYPSYCYKIKVAKNGAPELNGSGQPNLQNIDKCGYDIYPVESLAIYNQLNKNDVTVAKILYGSPPIVARAVFTLSEDKDYYGLTKFLFIDGVKQIDNGAALAYGCKPKLPNANDYMEFECVGFNQTFCDKVTYSAFGGIIIKPDTDSFGRKRDYTCGYNNYDIAKKIWDELDPNFVIGNPPSPNDVNFQTILNGTNYVLDINGVKKSNYVTGNSGMSIGDYNPGAGLGCRIITDAALCTRINSDGTTTHFADCVQCIGLHRDRCETQEYTRTGYPMRDKYNYIHADGQQCKLINLSEDYTAEIDLYNTLGPDMVDSPLALSGSVPSIINVTTEFGLGAGTTSEDLKEKYRLKVNGKEALSGYKGVACLNSLPSAKSIICMAFNQLTCSVVEIWKSGYAKAKYDVPDTDKCGYAYYGNSTYLDTILSLIDTQKELRADINQSASFEAVYDENYVDTSNPPNLYKKYYIKTEGVSDLAFVATRGIGCSPEAVVNGVAQRECIAFDQFNCYKRRYTRLGLAIDANWTIKQADCGYGYKATAASLYDALDPLVRAGEHPNNAPSGVQGKMKNILGSDKYIVSVFGADLDEGVFSKAVGCKPPGLDINSADPEKDIKMECIGFNEGSTFKRVFYTSGISATTWKPIQNVVCDPALTNVVDCPYNSDLIKQEYCKVKNTGTLATSGDPAGLSCP